MVAPLERSARRAPAIASAVVRAGDRRSDVHRARSAGPLRLLFPRAAGRAAWIVTSSLGSGLVDGDDVSLAVTVDPGATALLTTQSSTKVYRGTSRQHLRVRAHGDATVLILPDPVVPYRDAHFTQTTSLTLDATTSLVYADVLTAGRIAFGERWSAARIDTKLTLTIAGTTRLLDRVVLDHATRMRRFTALGTALLLGPRFASTLPQITSLDRDLVIAASPLADGVILRIAGTDLSRVVSTLRAFLAPACTLAGEDPWSRKW
ncbi:MAG: ureD [Myxococcales bacterium]|nr:ureD [Myxococcales bacterium]